PSWSGPPHRIQVFSLISPSLLTNCRSEDRILPSSIPRVLLGSLRSSPVTLGCRPGTRNQCCPWSIHPPVFYHLRRCCFVVRFVILNHCRLLNDLPDPQRGSAIGDLLSSLAHCTAAATVR